MIDYSTYEQTYAEPEASSLIETFRAIGYSIETAIADIIDNSITADSNNIWIDYEWKGPDTTLSITDDGFGMNNNQLIQAMRPGSVNPLSIRGKDDLGRFGLGLKTASFSQCRKFSVLSKRKDEKVCYWCWDLDFVESAKSWSLIRYFPNKERYIEIIKEHGTTVIWWEIDRLTIDSNTFSEKSKEKFLKTMEDVIKHLSMVFHRYIESGLNIFFRGRKIEPWDPFMIGVEGLQTKPETFLENGNISIKGFILPHRSKLSSEQYDKGKGPKDSWTAQQGFYVYRNRRLLVAGEWLGMFKKEGHYDLCRIRIDLPNNLDNEWQIDIKKSLARPPSKLFALIEAIAREARSQAVEVYKHKGKVIKRKLAKHEYFPLWEEKVRHGKRFYKINREHPLINELCKNISGFAPQLENVLQFIEETIPVPLITLQENENDKPHGQPFEGKNHQMVIDVMKSMYLTLISEGTTKTDALARIANIEPFNFYLEYLEQL